MTNSIEAAVFADGGGDFEAAGEGVHAGNVGVEEIDRFEAFAADFGVEVCAAGGEAAHLEDGEHDLGGEINVGGELVGVPAEENVAGVGVDRAEGVGGGGDFHFVLHGVAGEGGVVRLEVQFEMLEQAKFAEEIQAGGGVRIVLVLGGFLGLGLDVEGAFEADGFFVRDSHVKEFGEMLDFAFEIGVEQSGIAFAAAPENVAFAAEVVSDFESFLHLSPGVGEDVGVATCGCAVHVARVDEKAGGAPEELDAGALLLFLEDLGNFVEGFVAFLEGAAFRRDVSIVKRVEGRAELFTELEETAHSLFRVLNRAVAHFPRTLGAAPAEHIRARPAWCANKPRRTAGGPSWICLRRFRRGYTI